MLEMKAAASSANIAMAAKILCRRREKRRNAKMRESSWLIEENGARARRERGHAGRPTRLLYGKCQPTMKASSRRGSCVNFSFSIIKPSVSSRQIVAFAKVIILNMYKGRRGIKHLCRRNGVALRRKIIENVSSTRLVAQIIACEGALEGEADDPSDRTRHGRA